MHFPLWLVLALISPVFWAIVHVLDSHCVDELFDSPWMGMMTSGLSMLVVLPFLCLGLLFTSVAPMSSNAVAWCVLGGFVFMASQFLYFQALAITESGIVAAYWNLIPCFLLIISYLLLGEVLTKFQYLGTGLLIAASVVFCLLDGLESRWLSFWMMLAGALLQGAYFLIQQKIFATCPVYQAFLIMTFSMAMAGLSPLLLSPCRQRFQGNWPRLRPAARFLFGIELANLVAVATGQYAVSYGIPSLVAAVEAAIPGYTLLLSLCLFVTTRKYGEEETQKFLPLKLLLVAIMACGVWLIS